MRRQRRFQIQLFIARTGQGERAGMQMQLLIQAAGRFAIRQSVARF